MGNQYDQICFVPHLSAGALLISQALTPWCKQKPLPHTVLIGSDVWPAFLLSAWTEKILFSGLDTMFGDISDIT